MGDITMESHPSLVEGIPSGHRCISGDSLVEWRSSDQVENGNPSTSPSYWDTDDDDHGLRPSDLYGNFTWTIDGFSQISKRELRSNVFDVGGYKWYILIYPQGCDVCNHLSLFLCVANHDKLLPGWSHFAQFTIAVANKDSKKSKYSDTLHRFWKKEHDWGWKKFMELSKVSDGFLVDDALKIKAQVQVIRENAHQPFRCLDCQYRRELVRVYLSNVEKLCRRYVEEKKSKFIKIIEDKVRWSSFHAFWLSIDHSIRRRMSRDKSEAVLKVVVKHFFIENEVTSTLVMDYLYSGLKALEYQSRRKNGVAKLAEIGEMPDPFVFVEKDVFFLTDDVLLVLERAALEPLPPKDDKGSQNQNRLKECSSGDDLESIELDERRLTELGRRTVEMFALNHIYSMIEIAYQEAVSLRRQEELIREEEAAGQAESELRSRRNAAEKEKRTKKKQVKQKKNSRKTKDKGRSEKSDSSIKKSIEEIEIISSEALDESQEDQTSNIPEECNSPVAATDGGEMNQPESEERETSPTSWDTDASDAHLVLEARSVDLENNQTERKKPTLADDRPSTWSTESVLSIKDVSSLNRRISSSRSRRKNQQSSLNKKSQAFDDTHQHHEPEAVGSSMKHIHRQPVKEEAMPLENQPPAVPEQENLTSEAARSKQSTECQTTFVDPVIMRENPLDLKGPSNGGKSQTEKPLTPDTSKSTTFVGGQGKVLVNAKNVVVPAYQASNSPLAPKHRPPSTPLSSARPQAAPLLSRSVSAAGRLSVDPSQSTVDRAQSYRNAIMGRTASMAAPKSTVPALTFGSVTPEKLQSSPLTQRLEDSPPLTSGYHLREDYPAPPVHQLQAQGVTQDEFPHIDIINDLLNEENSGREVGANGYFPRSYSTSNERYFFAGGASTAATPAASVDDNYIFTLGSQLYEQLILRETGSFGRSIVGQRAQSSRPFDLSTGYMTDGSAQKQWLPGPARQRHSDNEFFYDQDYLDMVRVMNGFNSKFHPSNGH